MKPVNIVDVSLVIIVELLIRGQRAVTESQNAWGWQGHLQIVMSKPLAGSPKAGCSGPCSNGDEDGNTRYEWRERNPFSYVDYTKCDASIFQLYFCCRYTISKLLNSDFQQLNERFVWPQQLKFLPHSFKTVPRSCLFWLFCCCWFFFLKCFHFGAKLDTSMSYTEVERNPALRVVCCARSVVQRSGWQAHFRQACSQKLLSMFLTDTRMKWLTDLLNNSLVKTCFT